MPGKLAVLASSHSSREAAESELREVGLKTVDFAGDIRDVNGREYYLFNFDEPCSIDQRRRVSARFLDDIMFQNVISALYGMEERPPRGFDYATICGFNPVDLAEHEEGLFVYCKNASSLNDKIKEAFITYCTSLRDDPADDKSVA